MLPAILLVAAVAILALLMRAGAGRRDETVAAASPPPGSGAKAEGHDDDDEEDGDEGGEAVAVSSDGWAFVPDGHEVQLVPPADPDDLVSMQSLIATPAIDPEAPAIGDGGVPVSRETRRRMAAWRPGLHLSPGDLVAARVKRGAPDFDPWRLEALGRDGDYRAWPFETDDAAQTALALLERRVVRPGRDEYGEPRSYGPAEFEAARQRDEETERELDAEDLNEA